MKQRIDIQAYTNTETDSSFMCAPRVHRSSNTHRASYAKHDWAWTSALAPEVHTQTRSYRSTKKTLSKPQSEDPQLAKQRHSTGEIANKKATLWSYDGNAQTKIPETFVSRLSSFRNVLQTSCVQHSWRPLHSSQTNTHAKKSQTMGSASRPLKAVTAPNLISCQKYSARNFLTHTQSRYRHPNHVMTSSPS